MAYLDWYNSTVLSRSLWDGGSNFPSTMTARNEAYRTNGAFPLDFRTLRQSFTQTVSIKNGSRYPGLKVYVIDDGIEYIFKLTDSSPNALAVGNEGLKEYHPELAHFVSYVDGNTTLNDIADIGDLGGLSTMLGSGHTVTANGVNHNTIPVGAEGTVQLSNKLLYKYVWNGEKWTTYNNLSGSIILSIDQSTPVGMSGSSPVYVASINDLTSSHISYVYRSVMNTDAASGISSGTEVNVVFTDNDNIEVCRKYVYVNGGWYILQGVQGYVISFPAYDSSTFSFYDNWPTGEQGSDQNFMTELNRLLPNNKQLSSDIKLTREDENGSPTVYATISHHFNYQFIDAFMFEGSQSDIKGSSDTNVDIAGSRLFSSVICYRDGGDNSFKVKIGSLPLPSVNSPDEKEYTIILQK